MKAFYSSAVAAPSRAAVDTVLAAGPLIRERDGLGQTLVRTILDAGYPVTIGLGADPLTAAHLQQEAEQQVRQAAWEAWAAPVEGAKWS